jgi:hypothetical protein
MKRYGKYGRKPSWILKRNGKCGKKVGWSVKWYGKYGRKVGWIVKKKIGKIWKKNKLNSEKIWKIWKKSMLNNEMIWKIWKKSWIVKSTGTKINLKQYGKKVRKKVQGGGKYGKKVREKNRGKVTWRPVTSLPVKHAQWSDPLDPPQISSNNKWNLLYTTTVVSSHYVVEDCDKFVVRCRRLQYDPITISKFLLRLCNVFDRFPVLMYYWHVFCIKTEFRKSFFIKTL